MNDIVIIADFCGPLDGTFNSRFLYLADMLAKENNVEIITSDFDHGSKTYIRHKIEKHEYPITLLHEASYPKNICLRRFYGHFIWGRNVKKYLKNRKKPDVVFCAIPTLKASYEAAKFCKKYGIKFIIDIQDLWPEAFQMAFNIPVLMNVVFFPFTILVNKIYKQADSICAVSDTYCKRALRVNKKCKETTTVFLGTELAVFDKYASENTMFEKKEGEIWLAYCGTLGASYDINVVIDAICLLNNDHLRFIVMGDGPRKIEFEKYAKEKGINAIFTGRLKYDAMCGLLTACDITINPITHMAAQSIINKHGDYAASGLPVISTQENEEYRRLIDKYHMGYNCNNSDSLDLADKLKKLVDNENLRLEMGQNARRCAEERFDRKNTYKLLERTILNVRKNTMV